MDKHPRDYASPVFGSMPVEAITMERILEALTPLWLKTPETASRVRQRIERVTTEARTRRAGRGHLDHLLPPPGKVRRVTHHAAMAYADVQAFHGAHARARPRHCGKGARVCDPYRVPDKMRFLAQRGMKSTSARKCGRSPPRA